MASVSALTELVQDSFSSLIAPVDSAQPNDAVGILVGITNNFDRTYARLGHVPLLGKSKPGVENIVWSMGSNTKVFTATLLAYAASLTKPPLGLTTPVQSLLPSSVPINYCPNVSPNEILLWHLATHSAAWPDGLCPKDEGSYSFDQMTDFLTNFTPGYGPGQYFNYSNQGFALLGALASHALSESTTPTDWDASYDNWTSLVTSNVLLPLGMQSTVVDISSVEDEMAVPYLYQSQGQPYKETSPEIWQPDSAGLGAGALSTTLSDMLTFLEAQIQPPSGTLGNAIKLTQTAPEGSTLHMGLGWGLGDGFLCKDGGVSGYSSYMAVDTTAQVGVVVCANTRPGGGPIPLDATTLALLGALRGTGRPSFPGFPKIPTTPCCPNGC